MVEELEIHDVPVPFIKIERQIAMPFLPTTPTEYLRIIMVLIPIAIVVFVLWRGEKQTAIYKAPLSPDQLRDLILTVEDEELRSRVINDVRASAAKRPVSKQIFDKIVSDAKAERVSADQLAAIPSTTA